VKTPRDCTGPKLVRALRKFGYTVLRQTGSHIRLVTQQGGEHHLTVPNHDPIKVGTLHGILKDVAAHHRLAVDDLLRELDL
jgi:predicted RNA binding protein YcfA (HicA-like mRNA interferase family)